METLRRAEVRANLVEGGTASCQSFSRIAIWVSLEEDHFALHFSNKIQQVSLDCSGQEVRLGLTQLRVSPENNQIIELLDQVTLVFHEVHVPLLRVHAF